MAIGQLRARAGAAGEPAAPAPSRRRASRQAVASCSHPASARVVPSSASGTRRTARGPARRDRRHVAPAALALHAVARDVTSTSMPSRASQPASSSTSDTMNSIGRSLAYRSSSASVRAAAPTARPSPAASCRSVLSLRSGSISRETSSRIAHQPLPALDQRAVEQRVERRRREHARCAPTLARARQVPPQLVGRERQDRREQPRQPVGHDVHRRLRRAPLARLAPRTCRADPSRRRRRTRSDRPSRTR